MDKSLQTAKIEELLEIYKAYKRGFKALEDNEVTAVSMAERHWVEIFAKDLKWLLDDTKY